MLEGNVFVDLEPTMISGREEPLHLDACETSNVREAGSRLVVPEAQLAVLVQSARVQVTGARLCNRVMGSSRNAGDPDALEVLDEGRTLQVVRVPLPKLALAVESK